MDKNTENAKIVIGKKMKRAVCIIPIMVRYIIKVYRADT